MTCSVTAEIKYRGSAFGKERPAFVPQSRDYGSARAGLHSKPAEEKR